MFTCEAGRDRVCLRQVRLLLGQRYNDGAALYPNAAALDARRQPSLGDRGRPCSGSPAGVAGLLTGAFLAGEEQHA